MVGEGFKSFLDVVRQGHPNTPIVVISPVLRPDAEDVPNKLGATLADIRNAIESVTRDRVIAGDDSLSLVAGETIIESGHLADGIHPGDEGHKRIAVTAAKALTAAMNPVGQNLGTDLMREGINGFRPGGETADMLDEPLDGRRTDRTAASSLY
jgi:hypothetical protein